RRGPPRLYPARVPLGVRDQLDRVAELARIAEIARLDALDAFAVDLARPDLDLVGDGGQDRELVGGVEPADVVGRVGLRVAGVLRFTHRVGHGESVPGHRTDAGL